MVAAACGTGTGSGEATAGMFAASDIVAVAEAIIVSSECRLLRCANISRLTRFNAVK